MAHNLNRELQMSADQAERGTTEQRAPWWSFTRLGEKEGPSRRRIWPFDKATIIIIWP